MRSWLAITMDVICVVIFVVIGRGTHNENILTGALLTAAPFLIALAAASVVAFFAHWQQDRIKVGAWIWLATLVVGMALRATLFGEGIALPFIAVAFVFLGLTMLGWRALRLLLVTRARVPELTQTEPPRPPASP